jgi:hypothetical protein
MELLLREPHRNEALAWRVTLTDLGEPSMTAVPAARRPYGCRKTEFAEYESPVYISSLRMRFAVWLHRELSSCAVQTQPVSSVAVYGHKAFDRLQRVSFEPMCVPFLVSARRSLDQQCMDIVESYDCTLPNGLILRNNALL